jgi:dTDP-glucose pyrophosphorylase
MKPTLLILAAGMGSRYGGIKQIDSFGPSGESIMDYSLYDAIRAGFGKVVIVVRQDIIDDVRRMFDHKLHGRIDFSYAIQRLDDPADIVPANVQRQKPWGTAHAILSARDHINTPFCMINADDYYGPEAFRIMAHYLSGGLSTGQYSMVGYRLSRTLSPHGAVSRGVCQVSPEGLLQQITERKKIYRLPSGQIVFEENDTLTPLSDDTLVSMNFFGFTPDLFAYLYHGMKAFIAAEGNDPKAEYLIPSVISQLMSAGRAQVRVFGTESKWFGVTYPDDKPTVQQALRELTERGVYPTALWV